MSLALAQIGLGVITQRNGGVPKRAQRRASDLGRQMIGT